MFERKRSYRRDPPKFWWDMDGTDIIVQSDYPGGERLDVFSMMELGFDEAERLAKEVIRDYEAGRKTPEWNV